jgi:hypothetical protein
MQLTKQQWTDVNQELSSPYGRCYLICDDYVICASIEQHKMKLIIAVYINGSIKGSDQWYGSDSDIEQMGDISRKFWRLKTIGRPAKEIAKWEKIYGKREARKLGIYRKRCFTIPYFSTPGAFITHLKKHNQSIELVDYEAYQQALIKLPKESVDEGEQ